MDTINAAIHEMTTTVAREEWRTVAVAVAPSTVQVIVADTAISRGPSTVQVIVADSGPQYCTGRSGGQWPLPWPPSTVQVIVADSGRSRGPQYCSGNSGGQWLYPWPPVLFR